MIELPSLPTDNIYKFCSIGGLALIVFSFYYTFSQIEELDNQIFLIKSEKEILDLEVTYFKAAYDDATTAAKYDTVPVPDDILEDKQKFDQFRKDFLTKTIKQFLRSKQEIYEKIMGTLDKNHRELSELKRRFDIKKVQVNNKIAQLDHKSRNIELYRFASALFSLLGLILLIFGGFNWYAQQKILDKTARVQLLNAEKQSKNT